MVAFTSPQQASEAEIAAFEGWLGHKLPGDYRAMLLSTGVGHLAIFTLVDGLDADLQTLLPVTPANRREPGLRNTREMLGADRLPPEVLVVGVDSGGGWFCLGLVPPHRGALFHWVDDGLAALDLEDRPPGIADLTPVAPDWPSFLARLRDLPL